MINPLSARAKAHVVLRACRQFRPSLALALGFALLLPIPAQAGPGDATPTGVVGKEIARRQQLVDDAKILIIEGDALVDQREFGAAVEKYYAAYTMTDESAMAKPIHTLARNRFASFSVIYARELAEGARYDEANKALDRVLSPDVAPDHAAAKKLKSQLADPEYYNPAASPQHLEAVAKVDKLFRMAEGHMDLGDFDMANLTYAAILREDPTNEAARRGMAAAELMISDYHDSARSHFRAKALSAVDELWEFQVPISQKAFDAAMSLPGALNSNEISDRLRSIIVPEVEFTDESLTGVADYLTRISKDLDPTGKGINFVLDIDEQDAALRDISVNLILRSVPIGEVVRFVTESTGTKFRVEQFAVVITSLNSASNELVTKSFLVPPDFLNSPPPGEEAGGFDDPFGGGGDSNRSALITRRLNARTYLEQAGVVFPDGSFASHTVSNNTLIVRNTQANIDLVESLVNTLNRGVQQMVRIDVKQVEFLLSEDDELTFDILLNRFNLPGSSGVFGSGATGGQDPADFAFTPPASDIPIGQYSLTNGIRSGDFAIQTNPISNVTGGDPVSSPEARKAPSMFGLSSVFGDPQAQLAIRAINQSKDVTFTNQPTTVTQPGQRSVIEVLRNFPYPTEYDPPEIPQTFSQERGADVVLIDPVNQILFVFPGQEPPNTFPVTPAHPSAFDVHNVGTRMEVEPTIDPDGFTVTLNLSVEFSQFEGFINYGTPIATSDGVVLTDNRILQPLFKVSRLSQPVHVQDGANFVIGGIMGEDAEWTKDKVPLLGDVPIVGRLFRGSVEERRRKAVLFFVKVRILDPSGQPVHRAMESAGR